MTTLIIGLALTAILGAQQPTATPAADPRERLETAIEEGIRLLDKKEYATFLSMFVAPDMLARRRDTLEEFAAEFAGGKADRLLAVLKQIRTAKPTMNPESTQAIYELTPAPERGPSSLRWNKIGKFWYIAN